MTQTEIFVALQQKWIKLHGIKDGDKVRVIKKFEKGELGCSSTFYNNDYTGKEYVISDPLGGSSMEKGINLCCGPILPYFCLEPVKEEITYTRGQRFRLISDGDEYLLARVGGNLAALIGLKSGNLWKDPVTVSNTSSITEEEFKKIIGEWKFELIK